MKGVASGAADLRPALPKPKALGHAIPAVAMQDIFHCSLLRPYPGEDGSMLVKRAGARSDKELLSPEGLASRLSLQSFEGMNRPGRWLSMLSSSLLRAHNVLQYESSHPGSGGGGELLEAMSDEVMQACKILDVTQKQTVGDREIRVWAPASPASGSDLVLAGKRAPRNDIFTSTDKQLEDEWMPEAMPTPRFTSTDKQLEDEWMPEAMPTPRFTSTDKQLEDEWMPEAMPTPRFTSTDKQLEDEPVPEATPTDKKLEEEPHTHIRIRIHNQTCSDTSHLRSIERSAEQ
eukprot:Skav214690  [mRNA]  locus=scaffold444:182907:185932:+ [translate_table: standard]